MSDEETVQIDREVVKDALLEILNDMISRHSGPCSNAPGKGKTTPDRKPLPRGPPMAQHRPEIRVRVSSSFAVQWAQANNINMEQVHNVKIIWYCGAA